MVEIDVAIADLDPRHDGVRIAHLTDVHCSAITPRAHVRRAVELANGAGADVIALTGDYVGWQRREIPLVRSQLAGLSAKHVVAVLGNHDHFADGDGVARALSACGYAVLRNQFSSLEVNGAALHIVGLDDPVTGRDDIDAAFRGLPPAGTCVVLSHCPETAHALAAREAKLVLSGHTHGGQIRWLGVADRVFKKAGRRYYNAGLYSVPPAWLYVSAGIGFSGMPFRAGPGTRAEVAVLTLRRRCPTSF